MALCFICFVIDRPPRSEVIQQRPIALLTRHNLFQLSEWTVTGVCSPPTPLLFEWDDFKILLPILLPEGRKEKWVSSSSLLTH